MNAHDWLVILPILIPFLTAALCVMAWRAHRIQGVLGLLGAAGLFAASIVLFVRVWNNGPQTMEMSSWAAPFGIAFVVDVLGAGLVVMTGFIAIVIVAFALVTFDEKVLKRGAVPLIMALLVGVAGAFLTGDIFNLYVWLEVMLIASFGLLIIEGTREQIDGAVKYAVVNLVATTIFLIATGLLYGITGTLNMADLSLTVSQIGFQGPLVVVAVLYILALGMKAAAFPLFFWLPASYHTPPAAVSALFGALLTKVGVYGLFRVFTLIFPMEQGIPDLLLWVAIGTMMAGAIGALAQTDFRRTVAFLVVAGIGYMLVGLALGSQEGRLGSVAYILHSMVVTAALFFTAGLARRLNGSSLMTKGGGIYRQAPLFTFLAFAAVLAMSGSPPLSGLWPKVILVKAGLDLQANWTVTAILVSAFISLIALGRAFAITFWADRPETETQPAHQSLSFSALAPLVVLIGVLTAIGLWPDPLIQFADRVASDLADPQVYIMPAMGESAGALPAAEPVQAGRE